MKKFGKISNLKEAETVLQENLKLPYVDTKQHSDGKGIMIVVSMTPEKEWEKGWFVNGKGGVFHIILISYSENQEREKDIYQIVGGSLNNNLTGINIRKVKGDLNKVVSSFIHQFEEGTNKQLKPQTYGK